MTKLLQKAFDEAAKLPEKSQDALGSLLLEEIEVERRREDQSPGMPGTDFFVEAGVVLDLGLLEVYPSSFGRSRM